MGFTRTSSGLGNYAAFFGTDFTIFVEGKNNHADPKDAIVGKSVQTSDELFHHAIFSAAVAGKRFKIKSVGCKNDLGEYALEISTGKVRNCLIVYDSDYENVLSSWATPFWIMRTAGYSWENDLWVPSVCEKVISLLAGGRNWDRRDFNQRFDLAAQRLSRLSRVEVCCRCYGKNLIVPNSKSVGIRLNGKSKFLVDFSEVGRVMGKIKNIIKQQREDSLNAFLSRRLRNLRSPVLVRGHLWESACITLIIATLRKIGACQNIQTENVRNIALGVFCQAPFEYLNGMAGEHYKTQIARAGI